MRRFKIHIIILVLFIIVSQLITSINGHNSIAEAAAMKNHDKELTLAVGDTYDLNIKGNVRRTKWISSDKSIVSISEKGLATALTKGTATITGKLGKTKYKWIITVWDTKNETIGPISIKIPSDWNLSGTQLSNGYTINIKNIKYKSIINMNIVSTGKKAPDYETVKADCLNNLTEDAVKKAMSKFIITDYKTSDYISTNEKVFKLEYVVSDNESVIHQTIYYFYIDNYQINITVTDFDQLKLATAAELLIDSINVSSSTANIGSKAVSGMSSNYYYTLAKQYEYKAEQQRKEVDFCEKNLDDAINKRKSGVIGATSMYNSAVKLLETYENLAKQYQQLGDEAKAQGR